MTTNIMEESVGPDFSGLFDTSSWADQSRDCFNLEAAGSSDGIFSFSGVQLPEESQPNQGMEQAVHQNANNRSIPSHSSQDNQHLPNNSFHFLKQLQNNSDQLLPQSNSIEHFSFSDTPMMHPKPTRHPQNSIHNHLKTPERHLKSPNALNNHNKIQEISENDHNDEPLFIADDDSTNQCGGSVPYDTSDMSKALVPVSKRLGHEAGMSSEQFDSNLASLDPSLRVNGDAFGHLYRPTIKSKRPAEQPQYQYTTRKTRGGSNAKARSRPTPIANMNRIPIYTHPNDTSPTESMSTPTNTNGKRSRDPTLDPENHVIKKLRTESRLAWSEIAGRLNEQRRLRGKDPSFTEAAVYGRFVRNGPRIAVQEGDTSFDAKDWMFLRNDGKTAAEATGMVNSSSSEHSPGYSFSSIPRSGALSTNFVSPDRIPTFQLPPSATVPSVPDQEAFEQLVWQEADTVDWNYVAQKIKVKTGINIDPHLYSQKYIHRLRK